MKTSKLWWWLDQIARLSVGTYIMLALYVLARFSREQLLDYLHVFGAGYPLPEKDYGDVCQIYAPNHASGDAFFNVRDRMDVFVIAHALGWFVKALIVRDVRLSWICSILFELVELAFAHLLPNFNECWWDAVLLDVLGCNLLGIYAAELFMKVCGVKKYNFVEKSFKSVNFLLSCLLLVLLITLIDLNIFFLKFILFVPTTHWLCLARTFMWVLISAPASRELALHAVKRRFSLFSCVTCMIGVVGLLMEVIVCLTFRGDLFEHSGSTPLSTVLLVVSLAYAIVWAWLKVAR